MLTDFLLVLLAKYKLKGKYQLLNHFFSQKYLIFIYFSTNNSQTG